MRDVAQQILDEVRARSDSRLSVFDLQVEALDEQRLSLSGRLSSAEQLAHVKELFSGRLPSLHVETSSIRVLQRPDLPCLHVATNLTGLYEKPTFAVPLLNELYFGTELEVLEVDDNWVFARQSDGYLGWAYRPYLALGPAPAANALVLAPATELYQEPDTRSPLLTRLVSGTGVRAIERSQEWVLVEANQRGWLPAARLRSLDDLPRSLEARQAMIMEDSQRMTGTPYLWGGTSGNGIDCSGLARLLHRWVGLEIPRDADMQCNAAKPLEPPFEAGDLFFFGEGDSERHVTHVGISLGGWEMVHASRSRNGVYVDDIQKADALREIFMSAGTFLR